MRILVTGHRRLHRSAADPMLTEAGHSVVGLDSFLFEAAPSRPVRAGVPRRCCEPTCATSRRPSSRASTRSLHLAGISNDPLGDLDPDLTFDINYRGTVHLARLAKEAGVSRFVFSSSCSLYGAHGDDMLDEIRCVQPRHALRRVEGAGRARPRGPRRRRFQPHLPAQRDGVRVLAPAPRRSRGQQPRRPRRDQRRGVPEERRHAVAPARAHRRHRRGLRGRARGAPSTWCTTRRSTSAARARTTASVRSPRSSKRSCRTRASCFADDAGPDKRNYRVNCDKIAEQLPAYRPSWTVRAGAVQLLDAYRRSTASRSTSSKGPGSCASQTVQALQDAGSLGDDLRWDHDAQEALGV